MKKRLKFSSELIPLIVSGEKYATWRLWDDKNLMENDILDLVESNTGKSFATARIYKVNEKSLTEITEEDKIGQEEFPSDDAMYQKLSYHYKKQITPQTIVKVIYFKLI